MNSTAHLGLSPGRELEDTFSFCLPQGNDVVPAKSLALRLRKFLVVEVGDEEL